MALIESTMSVASSGPNMASIIEGSSFDEGAVAGSVAVDAEELEAAH
jgi:hypothetical protein